jgi:PKD repeat protein
MAFLRLIRIGGSSRARGGVVLYFNQMTWIAANEPLSAFDYNGNGRIDFAGVVWLFNHL